MEEQVVLVDHNNEVLGIMPKMEAHQKGVLHRAVSIMIYNTNGEILIQQRSAKKYHWPLIWCNACCSHPRLNESFEDAAHRRVFEELGIKLELTELFSFIYKTQDKITQLIEHEYDMVFKGMYNDEIPFNNDEIETVKWIQPELLQKDIKEYPEKYSFWFKEILNRLN